MYVLKASINKSCVIYLTLLSIVNYKNPENFYSYMHKYV